MVQAELRHEQGMRQVQKRGHAEPGRSAVRLVQRSQQDIDRLGVVLRQVTLQGLRNVFATGHQRQRIVAAQHIAQKFFGIESRMHRSKHARDGFGHVSTVLVDQGFCHLGAICC